MNRTAIWSQAIMENGGRSNLQADAHSLRQRFNLGIALRCNGGSISEENMEEVPDEVPRAQ